MNSLFWYTQPWNAVGVGENYDGNPSYFKGTTPAAALGQKYCGKLTDFTEGPSFNASNNTPRDADGIPLACGNAPPRYPSPCNSGCLIPAVVYFTVTEIFTGTCFPVGTVFPMYYATGTMPPPLSAWQIMFSSAVIPYGTSSVVFIMCCRPSTGTNIIFVRESTTGNYITNAGLDYLVCRPFEARWTFAFGLFAGCGNNFGRAMIRE